MTEYIFTLTLKESYKSCNMSRLVKTDKDYASGIEVLSLLYKKGQIKAATHVNSEMLQFYWVLGKDIAKPHWVEDISVR